MYVLDVYVLVFLCRDVIFFYSTVSTRCGGIINYLDNPRAKNNLSYQSSTSKCSQQHLLILHLCRRSGVSLSYGVFFEKSWYKMDAFENRTSTSSCSTHRVWRYVNQNYYCLFMPTLHITPSFFNSGVFLLSNPKIYSFYGLSLSLEIWTKL